MITATPNQSAERTGQRGELPNDEYDIHCVAAGGPEYKMNYFKASCAIRLEDKSCQHGDCLRYRGKPPKTRRYATAWIARKKNNVKQKKPAKKSNRIRKCVCCEETKWITARELCSKCHSRHRHKGTLEQYPCSREKGATVKIS